MREHHNEIERKCYVAYWLVGAVPTDFKTYVKVDKKDHTAIYITVEEHIPKSNISSYILASFSREPCNRLEKTEQAIRLYETRFKEELQNAV